MQRVLLTKRKHATESSEAQSMPPPQQAAELKDMLVNRSPSQSHAGTPLVSPHSPVGSPSKQDESHSRLLDERIKSEPRSPSLLAETANLNAHQESDMLPPTTVAGRAAAPISTLVASMVDIPEYNPAAARSPLASRSTTNTDEQVLQKFAATISAVDFAAGESEVQENHQQADEVTPIDPALLAISAGDTGGHLTHRNDPTTATSEGETEIPSSAAMPLATSSYHFAVPAVASSASTSLPRSHWGAPPPIPASLGSTAKPETPNSLYPGPSATKSRFDTESSNTVSSAVSRRLRTSRPDHPERFLYGGNTFSNLDDHSFNETAQNNPYLSQLTAEASRPVYKTPLEARQALRRPRKSPIDVIDYDQQISDLANTIADFRGKYEKAKLMTAQAGIEVAGNVWDRLSNIVQCPPDFNAYAEKGQINVEKYEEQMAEWDRAIGHQVIIKKRIVYREAIEKLQVKLDIVQAERNLDSRHVQLKQKAAEDTDDYDGDEGDNGDVNDDDDDGDDEALFI